MNLISESDSPTPQFPEDSGYPLYASAPITGSPSSKKVAFITLGCKLNQSETEGIADAFRLSGFSVEQTAHHADIVIVNTCAVTSKAEQKARRLLRFFLKSNQKASFVVSGCYAQLKKNEIENIETEDRTLSAAYPGEKRLFVLSGDKKARLIDIPRKLALGARLCEILSQAEERVGEGGQAEVLLEKNQIDERFAFHPTRFSFHSRAVLKIQDGCDNKCAYCAVRLARGKSVSLPASQALLRLKDIEEAGIAEVVLTGVNIGQYQDKELSENRPAYGSGLAALLRHLLEGTSSIALRLSSLDGDVFNDELFDVLSHPRIRPHFHLSIQSASEKILSAMGRSYSAEQILAVINRLRLIKNNPFIACDMISAFPGESAEEFEKTLSFCDKANFAWIHAFPFSPREGTEAYALPGKVSEREAALRVHELTRLAKDGRENYIKQSLGGKFRAIREEIKLQINGFFPALSENYLRLLIAVPENEKEPRCGEEFSCRITSLEGAPPRIDAFGVVL
ncbi:MAG: radical SAM protein [Spirochaetaceae bacterium]|jgi:threonylcarbamoyladenosine tRNA methylthiotransferase MtaB|nr:radical SAM protein [Spirochaetaceae bacterium]